MSFGTHIIESVGRGPQILANTNGVQYKEGGASIDWATVPPVAGVNEVVTFDVTAGSGNITITFGGQTATVAFDATADTIETALEALSTIGNGNVRVTRASATITLEFVEGLGRTNVGAVTGTGIGTVTVTRQGAADGPLTLPDGTVVKAGDKVITAGTVLSLITSSGLYGPANTSASDGRQTVDASQRGKSFLLVKHVVQSEPGSSVQGGLIYAGSVFRERLQLGGSGQPTEANFLAMFPGITLVRGS